MGRYRKDSSPEFAGQHGEDQALWEKVAETVKKMNPQQALQPEKQQRKVKRVLRANSQLDYLKSVQSASEKAKIASAETTLADFRIGEISGIDRSSARRLQRGQIQIEAKLDLHGLSQEQAHKKLISFISWAVQCKFRNVLIITGKGHEGQGILRQQVPIWLKGGPLRQHVNAISYAQPQDGGTGALYIRLKRQRGEVK